MEALSFSDPRVPIASNATGTLITSADEIRRALGDQIAQPVLWASCVEALIDAGCRTSLELGSGRVLSGLVRRIDRSVEAAAADSVAKLAIFAQRSADHEPSGRPS
jgi:[acyl-carrier-protein] S-malonyltransferase